MVIASLADPPKTMRRRRTPRLRVASEPVGQGYTAINSSCAPSQPVITVEPSVPQPPVAARLSFTLYLNAKSEPIVNPNVDPPSYAEVMANEVAYSQQES